MTNKTATRIYLIGFMGSGKSHIGQLLSSAMGLHYIDLDKEIEKETREIAKLEEANKKLKDETDKNTAVGEKLLAEMQAIEEEKKSNREQLDR